MTFGIDYNFWYIVLGGVMAVLVILSFVVKRLPDKKQKSRSEKQ